MRATLACLAVTSLLVVDPNSGFDPATDTDDRVHPNAAGAQKVASSGSRRLAPLIP